VSRSDPNSTSSNSATHNLCSSLFNTNGG
jgi:hypothetical protein